MNNLATRRKPGGYVLVMTLALLVMTATLLVTVARATIGQTRLAESEQARLQRKWGAMSCRAAILPHAEEILLHLELSSARPAPIAEGTIRLGDQDFLLKLADEQAKANVNQMLMDRTVTDTEARLRDAVSGSGLINDIHLRPVDDDSIPPPSLPRSLRAFGQILPSEDPQQLADLPERVGSANPAFTALVTLWGNGAINLLRAGAPAMRLALWPTLSRVEIDRLIAARDRLAAIRQSDNAAALSLPTQSPSARTDAISYLLGQAQIDPQTRSKLSVADHSACHSLWILVRNGRRVWYNFAVIDDSSPHQPRREEFIW